MKKFKIKVLSLIEAVERRARFQSEFKRISTLNFDFFDGIYGKNLTSLELSKIYNDDKAKRYLKRSLTKGEIGATYSHYLMYKDALESDLDFLIIMEDDSYINNDFDDVILNIINKVNPKYDEIIFLQEHTSNNKNVILSKKNVKVNNEYNIYRMLGSSQYFVGAYGYIVTQGAMLKLVANYLPIFCVCDHWYYIKKNCKVSEFSSLQPHVIYTNDEVTRKTDSYVNEERKKVIMTKPLTFIAKLKISLKRLILVQLDKDWE